MSLSRAAESTQIKSQQDIPEEAVLRPEYVGGPHDDGLRELLPHGHLPGHLRLEELGAGLHEDCLRRLGGVEGREVDELLDTRLARCSRNAARAGHVHVLVREVPARGDRAGQSTH